MVPRFFPDIQRIAAARELFSNGQYGDVERVMGSKSLAWPRTIDLSAVIDEFRTLVQSLGLADEDASFMVLVPVRVNGSVLTTPVLLDIERQELAFTSHPALGAGVIPQNVIAENASLGWSVREGLLGVLATWHNPPAEDRPRSA